MNQFVKLLVLSLILTSNITIAQSTPNPCDFPNVDCGLHNRNGIIHSFGTDTILLGTIYAGLQSGPGIIYGSLSMNGVGWFDFSNLRFSEEGTYIVSFTADELEKYKEAYVEVEVYKTVTGEQIITVKNINVYPNPVGNQLSIFSDELKQGVVEIYNNVGQLVLSENITQASNHVTLTTSTLKQGVYFVKVPGFNGTIKVVK